MPQPEYPAQAHPYLMEAAGHLQSAQLLIKRHLDTVPEDLAPLEQAAAAIEVIGFVVNEAEQEARDFTGRGLSAA